MPRNPEEGKTVESSRRTGGRKDEEKKILIVINVLLVKPWAGSAVVIAVGVSTASGASGAGTAKQFKCHRNATSSPLPARRRWRKNCPRYQRTLSVPCGR